MSLPTFTEDIYENTAEHGTCYTLTPAEDAAVSGRVFLDMAEHCALIDGCREPRPKIVFRFFGLCVEGRWLGAPASTTAFYPSWSDHQPGTSMLSLGEPGQLVTDLGRQLAHQPSHIQQAIDAVLVALSLRFLTDLRVAQYRQCVAERRCDRASRAHDLAGMHKDLTGRRYREARVAADAADTLLDAVRRKADS